MKRLALLLPLALLAACDRGKDEVSTTDDGPVGEEGTISDAMIDLDKATDEAPLDPDQPVALPKAKSSGTASDDADVPAPPVAQPTVAVPPPGTATAEQPK